ncbi:Coiled-coil protein [Giardia muris]|uniref:Coiled-coil protein n=1 Tax=Giardia muris TaxID=5742 RepID=A0A4Z1SY48_GIAMU|nr:Coiled-coil protein [Giardia muris]|eukprot:TNJ29725.1 Coiled-coil protein [Giardia muris]
MTIPTLTSVALPFVRATDDASMLRAALPLLDCPNAAAVIEARHVLSDAVSTPDEVYEQSLISYYGLIRPYAEPDLLMQASNAAIENPSKWLCESTPLECSSLAAEAVATAMNVAASRMFSGLRNCHGTARLFVEASGILRDAATVAEHGRLCGYFKADYLRTLSDFSYAQALEVAGASALAQHADRIIDDSDLREVLRILTEAANRYEAVRSALSASTLEPAIPVRSAAAFKAAILPAYVRYATAIACANGDASAAGRLELQLASDLLATAKEALRQQTPDQERMLSELEGAMTILGARIPLTGSDDDATLIDIGPMTESDRTTFSQAFGSNSTLPWVPRDAGDSKTLVTLREEIAHKDREIGELRMALRTAHQDLLSSGASISEAASLREALQQERQTTQGLLAAAELKEKEVAALNEALKAQEDMVSSILCSSPASSYTAGSRNPDAVSARDVERKERQLKKVRLQLMAKEAELKEIRGRLEEYEKKGGPLPTVSTDNTEVALLREQIETTQSALQASNATVVKLEGDVREKTHQISELQGRYDSEVDALRETAAAKDREIETLREHLERVNQMQKALEEARARGDDSVAVAQEHVNALRTELGALQEQYREKDGYIRNLVNIIEERDNELEALRHAIELKDDLHSQEKGLLTSFYESLKQEQDQTIQSLRSTLDRVRGDALETEERLKEQVRLLSDHVAEKTAEVEQLTTSRGETLEELDDLRERIRMRSDEIAELQNVISQKDEEVRLLEMRMTGHDAELNDLREQLAALTRRLDQKNSELELLRQANTHYEERIRSAAATDSMVQGYIDLIQDAMCRIRELESEVHEHKTDIGVLQRALTRVSGDNSEKDQLIQNLQYYIEKAENDVKFVPDDGSGRIKDLNDQIESLKIHTKYLQTRLSDLEREAQQSAKSRGLSDEEVLRGLLKAQDEELAELKEKLHRLNNGESIEAPADQETTRRLEEQIGFLKEELLHKDVVIQRLRQDQKPEVSALREEQLQTLATTLLETLRDKEDEADTLRRSFDNERLSHSMEADSFAERIAARDEEIARKNEEIATLTAAISELREELAARGAESFADAADRIRILENEAGNAVYDSRVLYRALTIAQASASAQSDRVKGLEEALRAMETVQQREDTGANLPAVASERTVTVASTDNDAKLKDEIQLLVMRGRFLEQKICDLQKTIDELQARPGEPARELVDELARARDELTSYKEMVDARIEPLEMQPTEFIGGDIIAERDAEIERLRDLIDELIAKGLEQEAQPPIVQVVTTGADPEELEALKADRRMLKEDAADKTAEINELRSRLRGATRKIDELYNELLHAPRKGDLDSANEQISRLKDLLQEKDGLNDEVVRLAVECNSLREQLAERAVPEPGPERAEMTTQAVVDIMELEEVQRLMEELRAKDLLLTELTDKLNDAITRSLAPTSAPIDFEPLITEKDAEASRLRALLEGMRHLLDEQERKAMETLAAKDAEIAQLAAASLLVSVPDPDEISAADLISTAAQREKELDHYYRKLLAQKDEELSLQRSMSVPSDQIDQLNEVIDALRRDLNDREEKLMMIQAVVRQDAATCTDAPAVPTTQEVVETIVDGMIQDRRSDATIEELEALRADRDTLMDEIIDKAADLSTLSTRLKTAQDVIDQLADSLYNSMQQPTGPRIDPKDEVIAALRADINTLKEESRDKTNDISKLRHQLSEARRIIEGLKDALYHVPQATEIVHVESEPQVDLEEVTRLQEELRARKDEISCLQDTIRILEAQKLSLLQQAQQAEAVPVALASDDAGALEDALNRVEALTDRLTDQAYDLTVLRRALDIAHAANEFKDQQLDVLRERINEAKEDLRRTLEEKEIQVAKLTQDVDDLTGEKKVLHDKITKLEEEVALLRDQLASQETEDLRNRLRETEEELERLRNASPADKILLSPRTRDDDFIATAAQREKEIERFYQNKLAEKDKIIAGLAQPESQAVVSVDPDDRDEIIEALRADNGTMREEIDDKREEIGELRGKVRNLLNEKEALRAEMTALPKVVEVPGQVDESVLQDAQERIRKLEDVIARTPQPEEKKKPSQELLARIERKRAEIQCDRERLAQKSTPDDVKQICGKYVELANLYLEAEDIPRDCGSHRSMRDALDAKDELVDIGMAQLLILEKQVDTNIKKIEELSDQNQKLQEELERLRAQPLENSTSGMVEELQRELLDKQDMIDLLLQAVKSQTAAASATRRSKDQTQRQNEVMRSALVSASTTYGQVALSQSGADSLVAGSIGLSDVSNGVVFDNTRIRRLCDTLRNIAREYEDASRLKDGESTEGYRAALYTTAQELQVELSRYSQ